MAHTAHGTPRTAVLFALFGAPHQNDMLLSALRLAQAVLDRGARVAFWTCGDSTHLTRTGVGGELPRNYADWDRAYPSTARVIGDLMADHPGLIDWYVCHFCAEARGAADQIPEVRTRQPFLFMNHVRAADQALVMGRF
ncbi:DsrE family protein [Streptomyces sp. LX-29]|uniref:DsrE family protein n=1 Tax=unclassified Streptomyces TaxID=2593676 RepID=UPI0011872B99|nr:MULTISPECIES: DsrE family protein [unclassified Streptomyces]TVL89237.1 hypothetical protein CD790_29155 [Streptomyces sp. SAJ15]WFB09321.1 DsrE family protein [Streptomyces sp. LX-29]